MPKPKPPVAPPPPPTAPTAADASVVQAGQMQRGGLTSLISTTPQGLTRKAATAKTSLIGGN
jgi:hypothetical protein